jgi:hypothetical protein
LGIDTGEAAERYRSTDYDLSLESPGSNTTRSLRAFGYLDASPAISQRTVNDSARVSADLSLRLAQP